ncbi:hypothetical protein CBL_12001 [Carabus blaptoides fortunei]
MSSIVSFLNETFNVTRCFVSQFINEDVEEILLGFLAIIGLCSCIKFFLKIIIWLLCPIMVILGTVLTIVSWRNGVIQEYIPNNVLDTFANHTISYTK